MAGTKTYIAKPGEIVEKWWLVDASDKVVGRLASEIAMVLMGKHRPTYTPHVLTGDAVIVINSGSQLLASESTLTFTAANYNQPQTIELYALDDAEVEGAHFGTVTHAVSGDSAYEDMRVNELAVDIVDNDVTPQAAPDVTPQAAPPSNTGGGGSLSWLTLAGLLALRLRRNPNLG